MVDLVFAFDNNDETLGGFYSLCHHDLIEFFESKGVSPIVNLNSAKLNDLSVKLSTEKLLKFVFLAYSHGSAKELLVNGVTSYLNSSSNMTGFKDSLFYTCSCHTGRELGLILIENGCFCYIGYKSAFTVWTYNLNPFIDCANYGIKQFFCGDSTDDIIINMKKKYNEHIDNYENDIFGAAILLSNRESLIKHGENISLKDLLITK